MKSAKKYPAQDSAQQDRFNLRMPKGMRGEIAKKAEENQRSMNSEMVARILKTLEEEFSLAELNIYPTSGEINRLGINDPAAEYNIQSLVSREELMLISEFRDMSIAKRKALLGLLK